MLYLNWESSLGCNYQVFQRSDSGLWTPVGSVLSGTGAKLQVPIDTASAGRMVLYRVRILFP